MIFRYYLVLAALTQSFLFSSALAKDFETTLLEAKLIAASCADYSANEFNAWMDDDPEVSRNYSDLEIDVIKAYGALTTFEQLYPTGQKDSNWKDLSRITGGVESKQRHLFCKFISNIATKVLQKNDGLDPKLTTKINQVVAEKIVFELNLQLRRFLASRLNLIKNGINSAEQKSYKFISFRGNLLSISNLINNFDIISNDQLEVFLYQVELLFSELPIEKGRLAGFVDLVRIHNSFLALKIADLSQFRFHPIIFKDLNPAEDTSIKFIKFNKIWNKVASRLSVGKDTNCSELEREMVMNGLIASAQGNMDLFTKAQITFLLHHMDKSNDKDLEFYTQQFLNSVPFPKKDFIKGLVPQQKQQQKWRKSNKNRRPVASRSESPHQHVILKEKEEALPLAQTEPLSDIHPLEEDVKPIEEPTETSTKDPSITGEDDLQVPVIDWDDYIISHKQQNKEEKKSDKILVPTAKVITLSGGAARFYAMSVGLGRLYQVGNRDFERFLRQIGGELVKGTGNGSAQHYLLPDYRTGDGTTYKLYNLHWRHGRKDSFPPGTLRHFVKSALFDAGLFNNDERLKVDPLGI